MRNIIAASILMLLGMIGFAHAADVLTDDEADRVTASFALNPTLETSFAFELARFEATASQIRTGILNEAVVIGRLIADGWARASAWNAAARTSIGA